MMATDARPHVPVMVDRVVELFRSAPDGPVVDVTLGAGGHARAIAVARRDVHGHAHVVGVDRDPDARRLATEHLADLDDVRLDVVAARFDDVAAHLDELGIDRVAGVFADLGISSMHVDQPERGFSFRHDGPLDMRMDPTQPTTAADLVNHASPRDLARILVEFGEERHARRIVDAIVANRPLTTTTELATAVADAYPAAARRQRGSHPATQTFQALRIAVNGELDAVANLLPAALDRLAPGGVMAVLAYHSLEDRLVKRAFATATTGCVCPPDLPVCACHRTPTHDHVIRRPERPGDREVEQNPRASAARLRAVRRRTQP